MSHTIDTDIDTDAASAAEQFPPPRQASLPQTGICLRASDLSRNFDSNRALDNVSFHLHAQRIGALVGPNGSGKSTLMRIFCGLLRPTQGQVRVLGCDPFDEGERLQRRVATLLHPHEFSGNIAVRESLQSAGEFPLSSRAHSGPLLPTKAAIEPVAQDARIDDLLYRFDLWPQRYQRVADLSASERAKLDLIAILVRPAELLLLDEPLAPLDEDHRLQMLSSLRTLVQAEGTTVLFATHALEDAEAIADDIFILRQGQLVAHGTRESLLAETVTPTLEVRGRGFAQEVVALIQRRHDVASVQQLPDRLYIHLNRLCDTAPLVTLLVESGADIDEVYKRQWGLHTRYRRLLDLPTPP